MKKLLTPLMVLIGLTVGIWGFQAQHLSDETSSPHPEHPTTQNTVTPESSPTPKRETDVNTIGLVIPVADFHNRITKKLFGTYITPSNSPVQPERFTGYHAGVDVEYDDVTSDVAVHAIANGRVVYAGWVSGYGGVTLLQHTIEGIPHLVVYGHLRPSSLLAVNTEVTQDQQIGLLGTAYSQETDGERRHLHFAVLRGIVVDLRGYSSTQAGLGNWIDPLSLYPH